MVGVDFKVLINIAKEVLENAETAYASNPTPQNKAHVDASLALLNDHLVQIGRAPVKHSREV